MRGLKARRRRAASLVYVEEEGEEDKEEYSCRRCRCVRLRLLRGIIGGIRGSVQREA